MARLECKRVSEWIGRKWVRASKWLGAWGVGAADLPLGVHERRYEFWVCRQFFGEHVESGYQHQHQLYQLWGWLIQYAHLPEEVNHFFPLG